MKRILIVDDDADLSAITARFLENEGFEAACAASAEHAYEILTSEAFDLILLDINLPVDDGFEVCRNLRRASHVPILFASARTSETDRITSLDVGGDGYIPKPYSLRELLSHVNAHIRRASSFSNANETTQVLGGIELDGQSCSVSKDGTEVPLSPRNTTCCSFL